MTEIGYAVMRIIPSLDGVSEQINKQLDGKLLATGKKGGKALAKGVGEGLKDLEREVESAAKAYGKFRDKAEDALGKIRVEEEKLAKARSGGKSDQIAAAEERLNKARRDSARATKEANDSHTVLLASQKRLGDGTNDLGRKFGSLSGLAAGAGTALASAGAVAGGAALAGIAALGAGVVVAGNRLYELGRQFDDVSDNLQVKTGLSGAALESLKDSVERLGTTNVPASFAQIGDVAAEVTRNLHLTGQPLDDVTSRLANLARMGQDVDIRSLGKVFRGFGIEAGDQAGALNSLYEISTKTGLSIDDLTGAVGKNGAAMRQLGLDFDESVAMLSAFEAAGLDGEKATKALNQAFAYFAKEGIPAEQGLTDIIARIKELGDTPEAGELSNKVFGAKGGAQFFEAIKNGDLDLQSLQSSLKLTGLDINQVSDDTADWSEKWQDLKNDLAVALEPTAGAFFEGINEELGKLATWTTAHQDEVVDFFLAIGNGAITAVDVVIDAVGQMAQGIGQFIQPFGDIQGAMLDFQAWQAEIRDDDETARELRAQAQDAYGWGESLDAVGRSMRDFDPQALRDKLNDIGDSAKNSSINIHDLSEKVGELGGQTIDLKTTVNGQPADLGSILNPGGPPIVGNPGSDALAPGFFTPGAPGGGGSGGSGGLGPGGRPTPGSGLPSLQDLPPLTSQPSGRKVGSDSGLLPSTIGIKDSIASQFPDITDIGGYRNDPAYPNEHPSGKALDVMIPNWNTPQGKAYGDQVAAAALAMPGVDYVLWQQKQWNKDGSVSPMSDRGGSTANHYDHVHIHNEPATAGDHSQGTAQAYTASSTTTLPSVTGTPGSAALNNAYGPGFEPGIGTPGVNEYGEPGYFEVDPRNVKDVQDRIADQTERIRESDEAARQAQVALDELEVDADQAEKDAAIERKRKADYDAQVARRELEDLKLDLSEAQQGTFSPAKESPKSSTGGRSSGSGLSLSSTFSGFGSALGEFAGGQIGSALDVFGVGDSPGWLNALSTFVGGIGVSDAQGNSLFDGGNLFGGSAPLAASPTMGIPPPIEGNAHGTQANQPPGPVYNIKTATVEDAFLAAQRKENVRRAAKLTRY